VAQNPTQLDASCVERCQGWAFTVSERKVYRPWQWYAGQMKRCTRSVISHAHNAVAVSFYLTIMQALVTLTYPSLHIRAMCDAESRALADP
jgi:hypothetical protein